MRIVGICGMCGRGARSCAFGRFGLRLHQTASVQRLWPMRVFLVPLSRTRGWPYRTAQRSTAFQRLSQRPKCLSEPWNGTATWGAKGSARHVGAARQSHGENFIPRAGLRGGQMASVTVWPTVAVTQHMRITAKSIDAIAHRLRFQKDGFKSAPLSRSDASSAPSR